LKMLLVPLLIFLLSLGMACKAWSLPIASSCFCYLKLLAIAIVQFPPLYNEKGELLMLPIKKGQKRERTNEKK
jgi:hypothetical protein